MTERTYTLKHPIEIRNKAEEIVERIETITLGRLRGEHARRITATAQIPMLVQMIGCAAGLPPSTMDRMDFEDILGASEVAADFFGGKAALEALQKD